MLENTSTQGQTTWFFISRLFILTGMVLFFSALSFMLGALMSNIIFGIDTLNDPTALSNFEGKPEVLNALKFLQVLLSLGGMLIPAWIFPKALGQDPADFLKLHNKVTLFHIVCALALIIVSIPLVSWLVEANGRLQLPPSMADLEAQLKASEEAAAQLTEAFVKGTSTGDFLINLLVVALVPAITEEFLFRGALQRFFVFCFNNIHVAVIISAALFSAFHGQVYGFMPRWILGIFMGYLFAYSGSIWPGVLAHFTNNALSLVITHFSLDKSSYEWMREDYHFPVLLVIFSVIMCILITWLLYKKQPKLERVYDK